MTTNYDPIAEQYKRSKQQPWRAYVEAFTLMRLIGDPTGKKVIDIACGEGFYTRMIRQRGAAKVTGVDLSEKMIGWPGPVKRKSRWASIISSGRKGPRGSSGLRSRRGSLFSELRA
jgi:2-polyprenyl-3-methyl-5-hydroxy-6-metoxy-1,4-benzoquinol methylase